MGLSLGQILSGAGAVGRGWRVEEEAQRVAQENQLKIEGQNRLNKLRQEMTQAAPPAINPDLAKIQMGMPVQEITLTPVAATVQPVQKAAAPTNDVDYHAGAVAYQTAAKNARIKQAAEQAALDKIRAAPGYQATRNQRAVLQRTVPPLALLGDVISSPVTAVGMAFEGAGNLIGRVGNAVTGKPTFNTNYSGFTDRGPTPLLDKYGSPFRSANSPEEQKLIDSIAKNKSDASSYDKAFTTANNLQLKRLADLKAAKTTTQKTASGAAQYDTAKTPYDALMASSATANGLDPAIFKRLIGTESAYKADAVSPRGASFGLGIGQIASSHGLSDAQRLDPNVAIPFAAKLFSQYLEKSGGNYEVALQKYKGASSEKGKAAMAAPISIILAGTQTAALTTGKENPTVIQTADAAPAKPATPAAQMKVSAFYQANPESIGGDMQRAIRQREEVVQLAGMYQRSGLGQQYMEARVKVMELDEGMYYLQGMQGVQDLMMANDPRRLAAITSHYAGMPIAFQPRTDGTYNVFVNGEKTKEGLSATELVALGRTSFDKGYRDAVTDSSTKYREKIIESQLKIGEDNAKQLTKMIADIAVEGVKGNNTLNVEKLKLMKYDVKPTGSGDGTLVVTPPFGNAPYLYNSSGKVIEIDGVKITPMSAYPIAGLPSLN